MGTRHVCASIALISALAVSGAKAQLLVDQDWLLNSEASHIYMQTVKAGSIFETHQFKNVEGTVGKNGQATVKIELGSLETGIDVRNVRMRFLLWETFKFPFAT